VGRAVETGSIISEGVDGVLKGIGRVLGVYQSDIVVLQSDT
jgi:hypothetical protein